MVLEPEFLLLQGRQEPPGVQTWLIYNQAPSRLQPPLFLSPLPLKIKTLKKQDDPTGGGGPAGHSAVGFPAAPLSAQMSDLRVRGKKPPEL